MPEVVAAELHRCAVPGRRRRARCWTRSDRTFVAAGQMERRVEPETWLSTEIAGLDPSALDERKPVRVASPESANDVRASLAAWLRTRRLERGISLDDVSRITKIQPRILE